MFYSLDAKTIIITNEYRLQKNGDLRRIDERDWRFRTGTDLFYHDYDRLLTDLGTIEDGSYITVKDESCNISRYAAEILERHKLFSRLHRVRRPVIPMEGELRAVILRGDDSEDSSLYIDTAGHFHLGDSDLTEDAKKKLYPVAVRFAGFIAGQGQVGREARNDRRMHELYLSMLQGWYSHLITGELDQFIDSITIKEEAEIRSNIERIVSQYNFAN